MFDFSITLLPGMPQLQVPDSGMQAGDTFGLGFLEDDEACPVTLPFDSNRSSMVLFCRLQNEDNKPLVAFGTNSSFSVPPGYTDFMISFANTSTLNEYHYYCGPKLGDKDGLKSLMVNSSNWCSGNGESKQDSCSMPC